MLMKRLNLVHYAYKSYLWWQATQLWAHLRVTSAEFLALSRKELSGSKDNILLRQPINKAH
eukprot:snap_masked-scaffold_2-processed-gene-12.37-mRNA-1 protein AED:1.00 eAED:1.00 QI:0/-1/0/0/-1/1/1/0/60